MLRTSRLLAAGAFLIGILLGASVCGAAPGSDRGAAAIAGQSLGPPIEAVP